MECGRPVLHRFVAADGGELSDVTLHLGDCLEYVRTMDAGSVDAVITDPPYGVLLGEVNNGQAREKNQQPYSLFSDTPEYIEQLVVPVIELCIQKFGRVVVTPGNRNLWKYPSPDDIGCWYVPAATSRGKWGFACMNPILYYGKSPRAGRGDTPNSVNMQAVRDKTIDHPCPKPLAFMKWLIEGSKQRHRIRSLHGQRYDRRRLYADGAQIYRLRNRPRLFCHCGEAHSRCADAGLAAPDRGA